MAELADALDSGLRFHRFPTLSLTFSCRAQRIDNTDDNGLSALRYGPIEQNRKLAQKLAQLRNAILHMLLRFRQPNLGLQVKRGRSLDNLSLHTQPLLKINVRFIKTPLH